MPAIKSLDELKRLKEDAVEKRKAKEVAGNTQIVVAMGTCGIAAGARETMTAILDSIEQEGLDDVIVTQTGCAGICEWEPIVEVSTHGEPKVSYGKVSPDRARQIVKEHVAGSHIVQDYVIPD